MILSGAGFDPDAPGRCFDAVLVDIDHAPDLLLHPRNAAFYQGRGSPAAGREAAGGRRARSVVDAPGEIQQLQAASRCDVWFDPGMIARRQNQPRRLFIFCSTSCANRASVVGNGALMPRPFRLHSSPPPAPYGLRGVAVVAAQWCAATQRGATTWPS